MDLRQCSLFFAAVLLLTVTASRCPTIANLTGTPNRHPIDTSAPVFVRRVPNGELYSIGTKPHDFIHLVHVYGNNGYDFGYAQGQLLAAEINSTLRNAWAYFEWEILQSINDTVNKYRLPPAFVNDIINLGLELALDNQNQLSAPFIDPEIFAELRGLADGSGVDYKFLRRIHYMGEITKGQCSLYGAWGEATLNSHTIMLRAFDWDTGAHLQDNPSVTVYHPLSAAAGIVPFVNVAWTGFIGVLTGFNANKLGIADIGISFPNYPPYFGDESFTGVPFVFLLKTIISKSTTLEQMEHAILEANRTCHLLIGLTNATTGRMVQYSHSLVRIFNDSTLEPNCFWHPRIPSIVYEGFDWDCPYYQHAMYQQLSFFYGRITAENTILNVTAMVTTGDLHVAITDFTDNLMYVANHAPQGDSSVFQKAFDRQFVRFNMTSVYAKTWGG
jgi:isopenicillin-N N-acyltransferase-like protein